MATKKKATAPEGEASTENGEGEGPDKGLILLNSLGTYAMKMTRERKQYELWERKLYEERTEIPNPFAKEGESPVKVYEAGEYSQWRRAPLPFPSGHNAPITAIMHVITWIVHDETQKQDVVTLEQAIEYFEMVKQDIAFTLKQAGML